MKAFRIDPNEIPSYEFMQKYTLPAERGPEVMRIGGVEFPVKTVPKEALPPGYHGYIEGSDGKKYWFKDVDDSRQMTNDECKTADDFFWKELTRS